MQNVFDFTGNPFVDGGLWGLMEWMKVKDPGEIDIHGLGSVFDELADLYSTESWKKLIYYLFPNGPLTNPSYSGRHKQVYLQHLRGLVSSVNKASGGKTCIACGKRGVVEPVDRKDIPLTGSRTMRNFFSYAAEGADYCPACTLAVQFLPLVLYTCGDKVALISSQSKKVMRRWAHECYSRINTQRLTKQYTKGIDEGYSNPRNALFHITGDLILAHHAEEFEGEEVTIRIYNFTNYGQSPDIEIFDLPAPVFRFLVFVKQSDDYSKWLEVVRRGFYDKGKVDSEGFKRLNNHVYNSLLENRSILGYFTDNERNTYGTWNILELYLKEVMGMDEKRLQLIKKLGDEIAEFIRKKDHVKRLTALENAANYHSFRNVLRLIAKDRLIYGEPEPLFTFDEYVEMIYTGDSANWKEIQDLLLFRIYEKLHDWLVSLKLDNEKTDEEDEIV